MAMTGLMDTKTLDLELAQGWLTVWFNQPEQRNPLTQERVSELLRLCGDLADRRDIRGVVFRGRGGTFCAGGDLRAFRAQFQGKADRAGIIEASLEAGRLLGAIHALPQVTVMAVEGAAMAGGFGLLCAADVVVAERGARFALTETRIGLVPAQIAPFVLDRLGARHARQVMLLAKPMTGDEAAAIGLVDTLADGSTGVDETLADLRATVRASAPGAIAETKRLIRTLPDMPREAQLQAAAHSFADRMMSDEAQEGIAAFFDKRNPSWTEG